MAAPLHAGESWSEAHKGVARVSIHVGYQVESNRTAVWITRALSDSTSGRVHNLETAETGAEWIAREAGEYRPPFFVLDEESAQKTLAALWGLGFRTKDALESGAHRTALEGHLADMRQLVAQFADVELPGTKRKAPTS